MGKSVKTFIFLVFTCITLFGATNYTKQLEIYDAQISNTSNDEVLRIFHGLKSIYIHSIISNDATLKKETLERLIKSAKILKIDASKYESELSLIDKNSKKTPIKESSPAPLQKESNHAPVFMKKTYNGKNLLQRVTTTEDEVILEFGENVTESSIKLFTLKSSESYKKVVDIPAVILSLPKFTKPQKLTNLRVGQYSGDFIRIVLDAPKAFDVHLSIDENKVIISFDKPSLTTPSSVHKIEKVPPRAISTFKKAPPRDKVIVIDAGHGGKDAGAMGDGKKKEKDLVLQVTLLLGQTLSDRGYKVFYTRKKDVFINLRDRTKIANDKNADLFISLHANAAPNETKRLTMQGLETFFLSPDRSERSKNVAALENKSDMEEMDFYSKETFLNVFNREKIVLSNKIAIDIQTGMLNSVKKKHQVEDGGVREAPFWVLVGATMPSVLVEVGYISHAKEAVLLFNHSYQKMLVEGISDGIDRYFINNP